jgi:hypothetical protein
VTTVESWHGTLRARYELFSYLGLFYSLGLGFFSGFFCNPGMDHDDDVIVLMCFYLELGL